MSFQTNKTHSRKYEKPPRHVNYDEPNEPIFTPDLMKNPLEEADEMYITYNDRDSNVSEQNERKEIVKLSGEFGNV